MTVITLSREFGCEGDRVAAQVAETLGYHLIDKDFIADVLEQYGLVEFNAEYDSKLGFWDRFSASRAEQRELMARMLDQVLRTLAYHGNVVIVGRSGFAALAGLADVLHVRLQAPLADRIARVAAQQQVGQDEAMRLVQDSDNLRSSFVGEFYGVAWSDARSFDLVINTMAVPLEKSVAWIVDAAARVREGLTFEGKQTSRAVTPDSVLAQAVAERLHCERAH